MNQDIRTSEHIQLYSILSRLVSLGMIEAIQMEDILAKSGLNKITHNKYNNGKGTIIDMN